MNYFDLVAMSQSSGGEGGSMMGMLPFILIFAIIYFLMIRPQSKKAKEQQQMLADLKKGDKVVTIGGLYGTVVEVRDKSFVIKIANNVDIEVLKSSIGEKRPDRTEIETISEKK